MESLTARQDLVLKALRRFITRDGIAPTLIEPGEELGMTGAKVRQHLLAIERKGYLRRHPGRARGLVVLSVNEGQGRPMRARKRRGKRHRG